MSRMSLLRTALVGFLTAGQIVKAHTWIEQLMVIGSNGSMVGEPGYPRGNVLRTSSDFGDPKMVNLIPPDGRTVNQILPSDLMCMSSQTSQSQSGGSPRLQAAAGSAVALRYQENGHVSLPANQPGKPPNRGTVYVYGTTQPSPDDSFLAIHRVWNPAGTGGDGRGVLLSTQNFDDGQCYQVNGGSISAQRQQQFSHSFDSVMGNNLWCQQDIALPTNAPSGQPYTLYWVWDWPTMPGTPGFPEGKQEIYTTCMDVDIVDADTSGVVSKAESVNFVQGQSYDTAGIASELADITNPTAVVGQSIDFSISATGPAAGQASVQSVSASATAGDSSTPAYISFHETATSDPGVQNTVIPVGSQPQQTGSPDNSNGNGNGRGGFGSHGGQGQNPGGPPPADATGTAINPQGPGRNGQMIVFTHTHSVFETVFQTIYTTQYDKRSVPVTEVPLQTSAPAPAKSCSRTESAYRLKGRNPFYIFGNPNAPVPTSC